MTNDTIRKHLANGKSVVVNVEQLTALTCEDSTIVDCGSIASAVYKHAKGGGLYVCWAGDNKPEDLEQSYPDGYLTAYSGAGLLQADYGKDV